MRIYLVRHGKASKDPAYVTDAERPLTDRGRQDVILIASQLVRAGVEVHEIRHSGLVRARQTAEIFGEHLMPAAGVKAVAGLHYVDPPEALASELRLEPEPVMFVGHNPFMENVVSLLLTGSPDRTPVWFSTSCTVCLEYSGRMWTVRWVLDRNIVGGNSDG